MTCQNCGRAVDAIAGPNTPRDELPDDYRAMCHLGPHDTGGDPVRVYHI